MSRGKSCDSRLGKLQRVVAPGRVTRVLNTPKSRAMVRVALLPDNVVVRASKLEMAP